MVSSLIPRCATITMRLFSTSEDVSRTTTQLIRRRSYRGTSRYSTLGRANFSCTVRQNDFPVIFAILHTRVRCWLKSASLGPLAACVTGPLLFCSSVLVAILRYHPLIMDDLSLKLFPGDDVKYHVIGSQSQLLGRVTHVNASSFHIQRFILSSAYTVDDEQDDSKDDDDLSTDSFVRPRMGSVEVIFTNEVEEVSKANIVGIIFVLSTKYL